MNIAALLAEAEHRLDTAGVPEASLEARLLFEHVSGLSRTQQLLRSQDEVSQQWFDAFIRFIDQRCQRTPLHYITGEREFWSLQFHVSPAVLIPRPETEFLLDYVLDKVKGALPSSASLLDLCTGSAVIATVLAKELGCPVVASDISPQALAIAEKNIHRHHVQNLVSLVCGDLFAPFLPQQGFACIVSNPPYIVESEIDRLSPEVRGAEPRLALSGGQDGLDSITRIAVNAPQYLCPGGWIFLEIGADQEAAVHDLFTEHGSYDQVQVIKDWAGKPRILQARMLE